METPPKLTPKKAAQFIVSMFAIRGWSELPPKPTVEYVDSWTEEEWEDFGKTA